MARRKSPSQKSLQTVADAAGGALELQGTMLAKAGYDEKARAEMTREVVERTRARATGATKVTRLTVMGARGEGAHVETFVDPDEGLRQRADEHLTDVLGLQPSRSSTVAIQNVLHVTISKRQPEDFVDAKVIEVKP